VLLLLLLLLQDCYLSFSHLLKNPTAAPLFKVFLAQLPQPQRPTHSHAPLLAFYDEVGACVVWMS
jgi:hypothetical protein